MSQPKKRVAVVFGGRSSEHAISCVTAGSVLQAIDRTKYDVVPVGIATDGRWVLESGDPERLRITGPDQLPAVDGDRASVMLTREADATDLVVHEPSRPPTTLGEVDVVFPLLHGPWGEDGTIQGML
ncbi:MAG: D-alanine--D-alanine ligase A, partial [Nocardioides sp.]